MKKTRLAVVFGGASSEHAVSLLSAVSVLTHLDRDAFTVYPIGITKAGKWLYYTGDVADIADGSWEKHPENRRVILSPYPSDGGLFCFNMSGLSLISIDCVFPVMHGESCEDGQIQGLLSLSGIPFVGSGVAASANCMDKERTKIICTHAGIPQAPWLAFDELQWAQERAGVLARIEEKFGYPVFIKPASTGSSVGISKAHDRRQLEAGIAEALRYGYKVLAEQFIDGYEIETAALGNRGDAQISVCGSVTPCREFYSYEAKYIDNQSETKIPADLPEAVAQEVRALAQRVYAVMECDGLSRIDFFVTKKEHTVLFNEINTMPGFTDISMYPKLMDAMGVDYTALLTRLVRLAEAKKRVRRK